jgi:hypothetical protein
MTILILVLTLNLTLSLTHLMILCRLPLADMMTLSIGVKDPDTLIEVSHPPIILFERFSPRVGLGLGVKQMEYRAQVISLTDLV